VEFIESRAFTRRLFHLLGDRADQVLQEIQGDLEVNPARGQMVRGLGGIRKARHSDPTRGKGKRGGLRYLYLYLELRERTHLLYLFGKNEEEDLTEAERTHLRELAAEIRKEEANRWQRR
jgi:hypothetical protein